MFRTERNVEDFRTGPTIVRGWELHSMQVEISPSKLPFFKIENAKTKEVPCFPKKRLLALEVSRCLQLQKETCFGS